MTTVKGVDLAATQMWPLTIALFGFLVFAGCRPSVEEIQQLVDQSIATAIAGSATETPAPTVTPQPAPTVYRAPTPSPQPTATPLILPATATSQPTPTPQPTATPQPTPTLQLSLAPPKPVDFNRIYRQWFTSVFYIATGEGYGSGWLIGPGLILTNAHVVGPLQVLKVHQNGSPPFTANLVATDSVRDIALLSFAPTQVELNQNARPIPLGSISVRDYATPLMAMGYSIANLHDDGTAGAASANIGVLSQIVTFPVGDYLNLVIDVPVDPGDSGGPILNNEGKVVGMVRAAQESTGGGQRVVGTFYAVHIDEIKDALPALTAGKSR